MDWKNSLITDIEDISEKTGMPPFKSFLYFYIKGSENLTDEKIQDIISVDKSRDGGCDGVYIDDDFKVVKIFQSKYTAHFGEAAFKKDELLKITKINEYLKDESNYAKFRNYINSTLKEKLDKAHRYISEHGFKLKFIFVTAHKNNPNKNIYEDIDVDLEIVSSNDLILKYERWMRGGSPELGDIVLPYKELLDGPEDPKSYIININCNDLRKIYLQFKNKLFSANVRVFQEGTKPNKAIKETLNNNPIDFWYFNNGITILAEKITNDKDSKELRLKNPQIINGCQTTTQIGESPPSKATLLVKIISIKSELSNQQFIDGIIEANNRQNPIDERMLKSNHPLQNILHNKLEPLGYYYETKEKEYRQESKKSAKIAGLYKIDNRDLVKSNLAAERDPHSAIKDPEPILFSIRFNEVFREEKHPLEYIIPYLLWKKLSYIGRQYKSKKKRTFNKYVPYHIIKLLYTFNPDLKNSLKHRTIFDKVEDENFEINECLIKNIFDLAYNIFKKSKYYGVEYGQRDFLSHSDTYNLIKISLNQTLKRQIENFFD